MLSGGSPRRGGEETTLRHAGDDYGGKKKRTRAAAFRLAQDGGRALSSTGKGGQGSGVKHAR